MTGSFNGGHISSDGGGVLLREVERRAGILRRFAACFQDHRAPEYVEHSVATLVAQRVYGLAPGYEGLNDHDRLRADPLLDCWPECASHQAKTASGSGIGAGGY